ncbi:MAG: hypothetical protein IJ193_05940, partial [Bacilli bacterium]|nr:hypothetical protein [Bacilli bacterium]
YHVGKEKYITKADYNRDYTTDNMREQGYLALSKDIDSGVLLVVINQVTGDIKKEFKFKTLTKIEDFDIEGTKYYDVYADDDIIHLKTDFEVLQNTNTNTETANVETNTEEK